MQRHTPFVTKPVPALAGIGLRSAHVEQFLRERPSVGWIEVHSENYFAEGGPHLKSLIRARSHYPVSLHGVGLSIGSCDPLDRSHLRSLRSLMGTVDPFLVSEHLCWASIDGACLNDLLPLPYTEEALAHMTARVSEIQDYLGREILIENVSSYLQYTTSTIPEWEFLAELSRRSGCGILLDINNIYVSSRNHAFDADQYLERMPAAAVREIHLAGHTRERIDEQEILIDTHNGPVSDPVWQLYDRWRGHFPSAPALIEWDADLPALEVLVNEARRADLNMQENRRVRFG